MGNWNPNYFEKKAGSLEEAILNAVNGVKTQINENQYYEYKFKNKNDAMKAKSMLDGIQLMSFDINDDNISNGELMVDAGKKNMSKYHNMIMKQFKPKVMTQEKLDPVGKEDGDIDNDGDKDSSDKYLAKRRKAIGKAMKNEGSKSPPGSMDYARYIQGLKQQMRQMRSDDETSPEELDAIEDRIEKAIKRDREAWRVTSKRESYGMNEGSKSPPGSMDYMRYIQGLKQQLRDVMRNDGSPAEADELEDRIEKAIQRNREASRVTSKRESYGMNEAVGKDIAKKMMGSKTMKGFATKVAKMKSVTKGDLENMLPDYVAGADISKLFEMDIDSFKPHKMYDPKTGVGHDARSMDDHLRMKKMGYTHTAPKKEAYELGTDEYTNHTKKITPGQFESQGEADWNEISSNIQKKQTSMREALAKVWGMDEGKSPFDTKEGKQSNPDNFEPFKKKGAKKENKTMTGKAATKVSVDPDMNEKKK